MPKHVAEYSAVHLLGILHRAAVDPFTENGGGPVVTLELVNVVVGALTFFAVAGYAGLTYATLRELHTEHKSRYDSYVAVGDSVRWDWKLEVTCLGPGPAQRIDIRADVEWIEEPGEPTERLTATVLGLPVGGNTTVHLQWHDQSYHDTLSANPDEAEATIEVDVLTVLGKHMPLAWFKVPYVPFQPLV